MQNLQSIPWNTLMSMILKERSARAKQKLQEEAKRRIQSGKVPDRVLWP